MRITIVIMILFIFVGCQSFNQGMTPGVKVIKSDFDGHTEIIQPPVSAASSLKESWHTMGFRWTDEAPDTVFLKVGVPGIENVEGCAFNIDGQIIEAKVASATTEYGTISNGKQSYRQFVVPLSVFKKISSAKIVKMKVSSINNYSVSSFGEERSGAIVNGKIDAFITALGKQ